MTWGCAKGLTDAVYFTIGTGVGAGIMTNGKMLHGMLHPEAGHVKMVPRSGDTYKGKCPYHGTCFEGMAAGPATRKGGAQRQFSSQTARKSGILRVITSLRL